MGEVLTVVQPPGDAIAQFRQDGLLFLARIDVTDGDQCGRVGRDLLDGGDLRPLTHYRSKVAGRCIRFRFVRRSDNEERTE